MERGTWVAAGAEMVTNAKANRRNSNRNGIPRLQAARARGQRKKFRHKSVPCRSTDSASLHALDHQRFAFPQFHLCAIEANNGAVRKNLGAVIHRNGATGLDR